LKRRVRVLLWYSAVWSVGVSGRLPLGAGGLFEGVGYRCGRRCWADYVSRRVLVFVVVVIGRDIQWGKGSVDLLPECGVECDGQGGIWEGGLAVWYG